MKKVIALAAIVLCTATSLMAQGGGGQRQTPEERIAAMKERLKPLNLTAVQTDSAVAILTERPANMGNFQEMTQEQRQEAMKTMQENRQKRLEKALGADLAKKVLETVPQGRGGGRPGGGGGGGKK